MINNCVNWWMLIDGQRFVQVRLGIGQAEGRARAWYHHRYRPVEVRDFALLRNDHRCPRTQRFHQEHDHWNIAGWLRGVDRSRRYRWIRSRYLEERTDPRARSSRFHSWREAAYRWCQQDGFHRAAVLGSAFRGNQERGSFVHQEDRLQSSCRCFRANLRMARRQHVGAIVKNAMVQGMGRRAQGRKGRRQVPHRSTRRYSPTFQAYRQGSPSSPPSMHCFGTTKKTNCQSFI